jgi:hypothetical protein
MSNMTNEQTDTALILEGELRRRVREVVSEVVASAVSQALDKEFNRRYETMLIEMSVKIGQMLRGIEADNRKPLWESGPEALKEVNDLTTQWGG